jgi:hypothetical protein
LCGRGQVIEFIDLKSKTTVVMSIQKAFRNIAMRHKEGIMSIPRKYNLTDIQVVHLDRNKRKGNRTAAKAFAAKVDSRLAGFQDSDIVPVAVSVNHKR